MDQHITWYGGIGLGPDDIVVDGDPVPPRNEARQSPHFSAHFALARSPISVTAELLYTTLGYTGGKFLPFCRWNSSEARPNSRRHLLTMAGPEADMENTDIGL